MFSTLLATKTSQQLGKLWARARSLREGAKPKVAHVY
jgi:hypothetical protein